MKRKMFYTINIIVVLICMLNVTATESPYGDSSCVEYDSEGRLYLVKNDCPGAGGGCTHQLIGMEEAIEYAREYQWIDVNASMKSRNHSLWEADLKLQGAGAKGLVMIYLPQGLDEMACGGTGIAYIIDAIKLKYQDHYPVDHHVFQEKFSQLIEGATKNGRGVLVTAKSYGAHQALEVIHDNPDVFFISIGPSFGIFTEVEEYSPNPHIKTYINNLANAKCKISIITSFNDCWSLYAYGSALSMNEEIEFECNDYQNPHHPNTLYTAEIPDYCYESLDARWDCEERGLLNPPKGKLPVSPYCYDGSGSCYVYGNLEVYEAIYKNRKNVKTAVVGGTGHYTTGYYDHGLIDVMKSCPGQHGMEGSYVDKILNNGESYYCNENPFLIQVDDLAGRSTLCVSAGGQGTITLRLQNLVCGTPYCQKGSVQVFVDGLLKKTLRGLKENESTQVKVEGKRVVLVANCGTKNIRREIYLDKDPPTIEKVSVTPHRSIEGAMIILAEGVRDDGYWVGRDYQIQVNVNGERKLHTGKSITIRDLPSGTHTATVRICDGCGHWSSPKSVTFRVSQALPEISFIRPKENQVVLRGRELDLEIKASAEGGVKRISIYLDRISNDEFDYRCIWYIPGVLGADGSVVKKSKELLIPRGKSSMWSKGTHTLIAVIQSTSGLTTTIERKIIVK